MTKYEVADLNRFIYVFFFNDTATTEIYTLSYTTLFRSASAAGTGATASPRWTPPGASAKPSPSPTRSEEHTSELQSHVNLVCRLLLEKKKNRSSAIHVRPSSQSSNLCRRYKNRGRGTDA